MRYLLAIALGVALIFTSIQWKKEVNSAESERDFWRQLYFLERRGNKVTNCEWLDSTHALCERKP